MKLDFPTDAPNTNVELLVSLCERSKFGALAQMFIVDALRKQVDAVVNADLKKLREQMKDGMITADAWHGVAVDLKRIMDAFYERDTNERGSYYVTVEHELETVEPRVVFIEKARSLQEAKTLAENKQRSA